jgi:predicted ATPase
VASRRGFVALLVFLAAACVVSACAAVLPVLLLAAAAGAVSEQLIHFVSLASVACSSAPLLLLLLITPALLLLPSLLFRLPTAQQVFRFTAATAVFIATGWCIHVIKHVPKHLLVLLCRAAGRNTTLGMSRLQNVHRASC